MQVFKQWLFNRTFSVNQVLLMLGLYFTLILNYPFLSGFIKAIVQLQQYSTLFLLSVPVLLFTLQLLIFSLFSVRYIFKVIVISLILLSSLVFYAGLSYGVVFDYGMIQNVFETHTAEALMYLNVVSVLFFLVTGILPAVIIFKLNIRFQPLAKELFSRTKLIAMALVVLLIIVWGFYSNYAAVVRNNSHLKRFIVPTQFLSGGYKYLRDHYFTTPRAFTILDAAPVRASNPKQKKKLVLLVVGETARAENFAYQGYAKATNQYTEPYQVNYFNQVSACGTATAVSVPCMFSSLNHENFDRQVALSQQNVLDIAKLAGVDVWWLDNNSGCQKVCERVASMRIEPTKTNPLCDGKYCFDDILLPPLAEKITNLSQETTLIVVHMIGSHGPTYYLRYPDKFKLFQPDCPQSDIQNCSVEQLVNTYDNTLAYSDYVLSQMMALLQQQPELDASMIYLSDHGESLGENGMYLHGFPYALAPSGQTHVPMWTWSNQADSIERSSCVRQLTTQAYSHDNLFATLLGLLQVSSTLYQPIQDIYQHCRAEQE
jgi:lipid A ethanolaminephosphotransferase